MLCCIHGVDGDCYEMHNKLAVLAILSGQFLPKVIRSYKYPISGVGR